jgi:hypothetical protein
MSLIKLQMFDDVKFTFDIIYEISFLIQLFFELFIYFLALCDVGKLA